MTALTTWLITIDLPNMTELARLEASEKHVGAGQSHWPSFVPEGNH